MLRIQVALSLLLLSPAGASQHLEGWGKRQNSSKRLNSSSLQNRSYAFRALRYVSRHGLNLFKKKTFKRLPPPPKPDQEPDVVPGTVPRPQNSCQMTKQEQKQLGRVLPVKVATQTKKATAWYEDLLEQRKARVTELKKTAKGRYKLRELPRNVITEDMAVTGPKPDKIVYFIRPPAAWCTLDGALTEEGRKVAKALLKDFPALASTEVLFTSPMAKALETAFLAFPDLADENIIIEKDLVEIGAMLVQSEGRKLLDRYNKPSDFVEDKYAKLWGAETEHWPVKFLAADLSPPTRWGLFVKTLSARKEKHIAVITHPKLLDSGIEETVKEGEYAVREIKDRALIRVVKNGWRRKF